MPNRIIREDMLTDERVNRLSVAAELFLRRLWNIADDYGRYDARPAILRARCYPLRVDKVREADISRWLVECQAAGVIALYAVDGAGRPRWLADVQPAGLCVSGFDRGIYLQIIGYDQQVRSRSRWPDPPSEPPQQSGGACMRVMAGDSRCDHLPSDDRLDGDGVGDGVGDVCVGDDCTPLRGGSDASIPAHTKRRASDPPGASDPPEWALALARFIAARLLELNPRYRAPTAAGLRKWAVEIDRLHRLDGQPVEEIERVLRWSMADSFWGANIQSGKALRKHWNTITAQMSRGGSGNGTHPGSGGRAPASERPGGSVATLGYTELQQKRQREIAAELGLD